MAKAKALWEGLTSSGTSGTYIRPHTGGYDFGRWYQRKWDLGYCFEKLGERSSSQACRDALEAADKACERRAKHLNRKGKRHG